MTNLDFKAAVEDVAAAADFLRAEGAEKVGVTGFCMGGALSLATAALKPSSVNAAAPFYGIPSPALADPATVKCPVQGH
jgi:carboxymethylenebutenolidase